MDSFIIRTVLCEGRGVEVALPSIKHMSCVTDLASSDTHLSREEGPQTRNVFFQCGFSRDVLTEKKNSYSSVIPRSQFGP